jgi:hypothetical protein
VLILVFQRRCQPLGDVLIAELHAIPVFRLQVVRPSRVAAFAGFLLQMAQLVE